MSQHDFDIANQTASSARSDINNALQALASLSSGNTAPSTTYANMLWYETDTNILKMRNEANSAWINVGYLDQGSSAFRILDDTQVMNTGGTQTGLLGDQATATWEAGSGTTESLVSPAKVKAAIEALSVALFSEMQPHAAPYAPTPPSAEQLASEIRAERNRLLAASDWTQVADAPVDQAAWATYRQALRDITAQLGFPEQINWPEAPQ
jgi:hypothetical protein